MSKHTVVPTRASRAGVSASLVAGLAAPAGAWPLVHGHLAGLHARLTRGVALEATPETLVVEAASAGLLVGACWVALLVAAGVAEARTGRAPRLLRALTPALTRRVVVVACGAAFGPVALVPALADVPHPTDVLDGLPLPERALGVPRPAAPPITVRPGDSLWALSEQLLPAPSSTARVDRAWRVLYAANRPRIGTDPDLLHVGTTLRVPRSLTEPPRPRKEA